MLAPVLAAGAAAWLAVGLAQTQPPSQPPSQPPPTTPPASAPAEGKSPDQIMKDLEEAAKRTGGVPGINPPGAGSGTPRGVTSAPAQGRLLREGTYLSSRTGRLTRAGNGEWLLTFDADKTGVADAPMVLMPCLNLMAMEKLVEKGGDAISFTVSGQVFVYKGRNHLLPSLYAVNRQGEVTPGG
jgi:hypothetical protein